MNLYHLLYLTFAMPAFRKTLFMLMPGLLHAGCFLIAKKTLLGADYLALFTLGGCRSCCFDFSGIDA